METTTYEVILLLEDHVNDPHNPILIFKTWDHAMYQIETFVNQGYEALIRIAEEE